MYLSVVYLQVWDPRLAVGKAEVRDGLFLAQLGLADQGTEQRR